MNWLTYAASEKWSTDRSKKTFKAVIAFAIDIDSKLLTVKSLVEVWKKVSSISGWIRESESPCSEIKVSDFSDYVFCYCTVIEGLVHWEFV